MMGTHHQASERENERMLSALITAGQYAGVYLIAIITGWLTINPIIRFLSRRYLGQGNYGSWLPRLIGATEQIIVTTAFLLNRDEIIGFWLLLKTAGEWRTQEKEAPTSTLTADYQIFLVGTALSVALSFATATIIQKFFPLF
jgi:hypothetical protein